METPKPGEVWDYSWDGGGGGSLERVFVTEFNEYNQVFGIWEDEDDSSIMFNYWGKDGSRWRKVRDY